jgi:hypothetical protein
VRWCRVLSIATGRARAGRAERVKLAAEDGLDPGRAGVLVEVDGAEEVPVIGEGERREAQVRGPLDQTLQAGRAVEEAVLRVDVEVNEVASVRHGGLSASGSRR